MLALSRMTQFRGRPDLGRELLLFFGQGAEITFDLQAVPEFGGLAEKGTKADRHGGRDGALTENDLVNGAGRHAKGAGHGVLRNTHRQQVFFEEDFAGSDWRVHSHNV